MTTIDHGLPQSTPALAVAEWPTDSTAASEPHEVHRPILRALERFALITFALYHVPLWLNNYPSLGGGGFNDNGLAVRWGHVFTTVGIWVARYLFHMTGPMTQAAAGDNGDVGEEYARLLVAVAIGIVGAVLWTFADRKRPGGRWVGNALHVLLRYSIAFGLVSYGIAKIFPQQFPPIGPFDLEQRLGDLTPMALLWEFMKYSRPYAFFGGLMELLAVALLCFRRTATLGALVCLAVMTNVALLNWAYGVPVKLYATMLVLSSLVLVLYDLPRLIAVFVTNEATSPAPLSSLLQDRIRPPLRWTIKIALVGSVVVSSVIAMLPSVNRATASSPLTGAWLTTAFALNGAPLDSTGNPARWQRVIVDRGVMQIRLQTGDLLPCRRTPSTDASMIVLGCARGQNGTLHWTRAGDALKLEGRFGSDSVAVLANHVDPADYRLLGTKFRLISDR